MSNFINFTTNHREKTYENPVHDGKRAKRFREVQGIKIDGERVDFRDDSIPERVQRYLLETRALRRRGIVNDCVAFVALMNTIELKDRTHNPFTNFDSETSLDPAAIDYDDMSPLVLTQDFHNAVRVPRHIILPAHLTDRQNYLHKLGDKGPLCMSDLEDSLAIMGCTSAHLIDLS